MSSDSLDHAFIADSRLYIRRKGEPEEIESPFALNNLEGHERRKSFSGWKSADEAESGNPYSTWGKQGAAQGYSGFRFLALTPALAGNIYYLITNNHVTGLFLYNPGTGEERRLFHKNDFFCSGLDFSPVRNELLCAVMEADGAVNLNLYDAEGRYKVAVTGGDSRDSQPAFSRHKSGHVLYQSAGIARHEGGGVLALGPESIHRLDLESGEMEEIVSDDNYDFLQPRDDREGNIYCIRRPYQAPGGFHPLQWLGNALLFPFRFLAALVGFLQAFTHLFEEKPRRLGPNKPIPEKDKYIIVLGQAVNLAKVSRPRKGNEDPSLVSAQYELVRILPDGDMEILATHVSGYDVNAEGVVHYTNGFRVQTPGENHHPVVFRHPVIESFRLMF